MTTLHACLLALALAFAGMAGLGFAMDRHYQQLTQAHEAPPGHRRLLRGAGAVLLTAAVAPCWLAWGGSVGVVVWLGFLSAGALCVALLLPYLPLVAALAAAFAGVAGVGGMAMWLAPHALS